MGTKLQRKNVKIFAENSAATLITEFRSESVDGSTASFSRDPDVIQNANYEQGWVEDTNNLNTKIFGEDMNAVSYVQSYLLKYLYENGIPEWSSSTEYFEHSITRVNDRLFISLTNNNVNNNPTSTVEEWAEIPLSAINIVTSGTGSSVFNSAVGNNITLKSLSVDGYGSLQDNGDQLNIHIVGSEGIVDAFWGQIQGTLTNQTDLVSALNTKQDNLTFSTPLSKDVNNAVSISKATSYVNGYLAATDFATFSAKQNALTGFTHSYSSGTDTAQIYPTATNSNLGTSGNSLTTTYTANVGSPGGSNNKINFSSTNGGDVIYDCGITGSGNYGSHVFKIGSGQKLSIGASSSEFGTDLSVSGKIITDKIQGKTTATSLETAASIVPDTDNTYNLGSSANKSYATTYTRNVGAPGGSNNKINFSNTNGGDVVYDCGISGSGNYGNHVFKIGSGEKFIIKPNDVEFDNNIIPKSGSTVDIGSSSSAFNNVYATKVISNTIDDISGGVIDINASTNLNGHADVLYDLRINRGRKISFRNSGTEFAYIDSTGSNTLRTINTSGQVSITSYNGNIIDTSDAAFGTTLKSNGGTCAEFVDAHIKIYKSIILNADNTTTWGTDTVGPNRIYAHDFSQISDIRNKEDIKDYEESVLTKIKGLSPITYKEKNADGQRLGLSAQNLAEIEPLCVSGGGKKSDERLSIDLYSLITLSIKAIKELNDKVESLEKRVAELEGKNSKELEK